MKKLLALLIIAAGFAAIAGTVHAADDDWHSDTFTEGGGAVQVNGDTITASWPGYPPTYYTGTTRLASGPTGNLEGRTCNYVIHIDENDSVHELNVLSIRSATTVDHPNYEAAQGPFDSTGTITLGPVLSVWVVTPTPSEKSSLGGSILFTCPPTVTTTTVPETTVPETTVPPTTVPSCEDDPHQLTCPPVTTEPAPTTTEDRSIELCIPNNPADPVLDDFVYVDGWDAYGTTKWTIVPCGPVPSDSTTTVAPTTTLASGTMPATGDNPFPLVLLGLGLLGAGGVALILSRRGAS